MTRDTTALVDSALTSRHSVRVFLPPAYEVLCGMSLGYEDSGAVENSLRTERAPLAEWSWFHD